MRDERLSKLAKLLVEYSLHLAQGELFDINAGLPAKPLVKAVMQAGQRAGAVPLVRLEDDELTRLSFGYIDPEHPEKSRDALEKIRALRLAYWKDLAAHVDIGVDENDAELSAVDPRARRAYLAAMKPVRDLIINERRWVYLHWPTPADAQKAGMCYDDFYEFFLGAALVDYEKMGRDMAPLAELMGRTDRVRILGPGTDLSFSIKGIPVVPCHGQLNIPDGEVFTAPVKDSVNGVIQYNTAAMRYGKKFANPRLVIRNGHIDEASCDGDVIGFNELLDADEGARYFGEFAIGVNNAVTKAIGNTLYDEKIGGSFHLTPGDAYDEAPNGNKSQLHLDIVCIQTAACGGGEIWFDDLLVRKDGLFVPEALRGLNP